VAPISTGSGTPFIFVIPYFWAQYLGNLFILAKNFPKFWLSPVSDLNPDVAGLANSRMLELAHSQPFIGVS
jgi:hypothetical protein